MTEQEMWLSHARAISKRARWHISIVRQAEEEYVNALAFARDATLTPLELAHARAALEQFRFQQAAR